MRVLLLLLLLLLRRRSFGGILLSCNLPTLNLAP